jgi:hypothetical protein
MITLTLSIITAAAILWWTYCRVSDYIFFRKIERLIADEQERQNRE